MFLNLLASHALRLVEAFNSPLQRADRLVTMAREVSLTVELEPGTEIVGMPLDHISGGVLQGHQIKVLGTGHRWKHFLRSR